MPFQQSVDEYLEFLHSTSVLTRAQLGDRAEAFDADVRAVFARHGIARLRYAVIGSVTWALPMQANSISTSRRADDLPDANRSPNRSTKRHTPTLRRGMGRTC